jgi:hypothetical protein
MSGSPTNTVSLVDINDFHSPKLAPSQGGFAIQDAIEDQIKETDDDDWERDPVNPRNWSPTNKWVATTLVS